MNTKNVLALFLCCLSAGCTFAQTRHALIVAIGNYPDPKTNGWPAISSENDIPLIKNALVNNQHFSENNVWVLKDSMATKQGIVDALDKLIATVNRGDIAVIHFSCHGEQIEDDNNDEIDGLDETIVPYGAVFSRNPEKFAQLSSGYLRDDLFGDKVTQLRNKLGKTGDLLVTIDACHSGTGTRGVVTAKIRGGNIAMVSKNFNAAKFTDRQDTGVFKETISTKLNADAATYVLISGAQAREVNAECYDDENNPVGSLSYSFSKSIAALKGTITYRGLFALIENIMRDKAPNQKPVLEGDGIDRDVFGGRYEQQQPYFSVNKGFSKNNLVALNAGFVSGITKGSTINFFEPGITNTTGKKPLNTGKVVSAGAFTSMVQPDTADDKLLNINPWAFVRELSYGADKLKFFVHGIGSMAKMIQDSLKDFQLVTFNQNCDLFLDTLGSLNNWALKYPNSNTVFRDGFSFSGHYNLEVLKASLRQFARFRYLKGLAFNEPGLSANVQLIFLQASGGVDAEKMASRTHFGRLELKEDDNVFLRIVNNGSKQFYINVVDIQPDGIINPVLPNKNLKDKNGNPAPIIWEDCQINKYDTLNFAISISKPFGEETFKVFLSAAPLDLEAILTVSNQINVPPGRRGILNGLEKIFINATVNESGNRGVVGSKINTDQNGTVFSINFQILPK